MRAGEEHGALSGSSPQPTFLQQSCPTKLTPSAHRRSPPLHERQGNSAQASVASHLLQLGKASIKANRGRRYNGRNIACRGNAIAAVTTTVTVVANGPSILHGSIEGQGRPRTNAPGTYGGGIIILERTSAKHVNGIKHAQGSVGSQARTYLPLSPPLSFSSSSSFFSTFSSILGGWDD